MGSPLVSVIIPVFNGERYLAQALQSVVAQTYTRLEILAIDDESTDRSADVVAGFGRYVRYVHQINAGAGAARNRGVESSNGDLVAFLDQDDLWSLDKLARQVETLQTHTAVSMAFGRVKQFYSPDWEPASRPVLYCPDRPVPGYLPSALLIRREALLRVGPFETHWRIGEWAEWYVRAVDAGEHSVVVPRTVAWRRLHEHNQGLTARTATHEYARILGTSLARRRRRATPPGYQDRVATGVADGVAAR